MNQEGTVYFIQPTELINTNKYKIGMSKENDLKRLRCYHKGTRFICIMSCMYPVTLEGLIKKNFKDKYKLIAGTEYFEGDENEMLIHFLEIIKDNNKNNVKDKEVEIKNENLNDLEINKEENIETKVINKEIKINKKVYFCDICKKKYKNYKCLWSHTKKFHQKSNIVILKHECTHCKKQFNDKSNRYKHQKICKNKKSEIEELKEKVNTQINLHDNLIKIIEKLANSNNN